MKNNNQQWQLSGAKWISAKDCAHLSNVYLQFARNFEIDEPDKLEINITAVSQYQLLVNGKMIGRGPAVSSQELYYFDGYSVSADHLIKGRNLVTVLLFHDGLGTKTAQHFIYGQPGLLVSITGKKVSLVSDKAWKVKRSERYTGSEIETGTPMISKWGGYKEFYHGDNVENWTSLDYCHEAWSNADEIAPAISSQFARNLIKLDLERLHHSEIYPIQIVDASRNFGKVNLPVNELPLKYELQPVQISADQPLAMPSLTFDFGEVVVGYPLIEIQGGFCIFELWYGETLDLARADVVRKGEDNGWNAFQRRSARFMKINFIAIEGEIVLKKVAVVSAKYSYDDRGLMHSCNEKINNIIKTCRKTQMSCTSYHFEDCPWREQAMWVLDMRIMALVNYYNFGDTKLVAKCLRQLFALQNDQGALPSVGPKASRCSFLDFSFNLIGALKEYYLYSGDIELMNELMLHVQKFASCLTAYMDSDGLIDSSLANGTVFLDWSKDIDKAGKSVILNAFYSKFLEDYELLLTITGQVNTNLKSTRAKVKETINKLMFDRTRQVYRDTILGGKLSSHASMHAAYAAVYSDFVTQNQHEFLENAARTLGNSTPYGPAYFMIIFDAMNKAGDRSQIMDRIVSYWGGMLDRGATSWWEVFDSKGPAWMYPHPFLGNTPTYEKDWIPTSSCHGWGCVPGYAIPRYLLGIELLTLFKNLVIVNPPAHAHFSHFTFKVPLRGDVLWLEFDRMGSAYAVHVVQKPSGIQVEISSQVKEYNGLCTVSSSML